MEPKTATTHPANLLTKIAGLISAVLGLVVIAGWYTGNISLLKISPSFPEMKFNTALGFFLSGTGLLSVAFSLPRLTFACGGILSSIGLLSFIQYIFGINLGIDQLLMRDYISSSISYPGRMAPNTAINFAFIGISLLLMHTRPRSKHYPMALGLIGSIILAIASIALFGYILGIRTAYVWGDRFIGMAVHTATGFTFVSAAIVALAWDEERAKGNALPSWLPVIIGIGALTATLIIWRGVAAQ
ncbi:MAG: hypothetical protein AAB275_07630, partial [Deltaproteobacteria bacterium]